MLLYKFRAKFKKIGVTFGAVFVVAVLSLAAFTIDFSSSVKSMQSPYGQIDFEKVLRGKNFFQITFAVCYGRLIQAVFHEAVSPKVLMGQDDWLFYAGESTIEDMLATSPCPESLKTTWAEGLRQRADWLASRGIVYRVVMVPDKHSVYPEYLPERVRARLAVSRFQQIADYLGDTACLVDLRQALLAAKAQDKGRLYIHTDSHWTNLGAYRGYLHIMGTLGEEWLESTVRMDGGDVVTGGAVARDLAKFNGLDSSEGDVYFPAIFGPNFFFRRRQVILPEGYTAEKFPLGVFSTFNEKREKSVVVFRDSFTSSMEPFLSSSFRHATYYWTIPSDDLFYKVVELERPDVVIEERAERYFKDAPEAGLDKILAKYDALKCDPLHSLECERTRLMNSLVRGRLAIAGEKQSPWIVVDNVQIAEIFDDLPLEGAVESVTHANGRMTIAGWTRSSGQDRPIDCILAVKADTAVYVTPAGNAGADAAVSQGLQPGQAGFVMSIPATFVPDGEGPIDVYAIMGRSARLIKSIGGNDHDRPIAATSGKP
jgi:hypothetical protein